MSTQDNALLTAEMHKVMKEVSALVQFMSDKEGAPARSQESSANSSRNNKKIASKTMERLEASSNLIDQAIGSSIKLNGETNRILEQSVQASTQQYARIIEEARIAGWDTAKINEEVYKEMGIELKDAQYSVHEFGEAAERAADEHDRASQEIRSSGNHLVKTFKDMADKMSVAAVVKGVGQEVVDVVRASAKSGAEINAKEMITARAMGMSQAKLIEMNGKYLQTMGRNNQTTTEWSDRLLDGSISMVKYTGSMTASADMFAENQKLANLAGETSVDGADSFTTAMDQAFIKLNKRFGTTSDRFSELNAAMFENTSMQANMFKQSASQRSLMIQTNAAMRVSLGSYNLIEGQVTAILNRMAEMLGGTERDRAIEAAKTQSVLGAMGMIEEGQRAAEIMRKGERASAEERQEYADIMIKANKQSSENYQNGSDGQRFTQDKLNEQLKDLGTGSDYAPAVIQGNADRLEAEKEAQALQARRDADQIDALEDNKRAIIQAADIANELMRDNIFKGAFEGIVYGMAASDFGKFSLGKLMDRFGGRTPPGPGGPGNAGSIREMLKNIGSGMLRMLTSRGFALAVGGTLAASIAFAVGWGVGTWGKEFIDKKFPEFGKKIDDFFQAQFTAWEEGSIWQNMKDFWGAKLISDPAKKAEERNEAQQSGVKPIYSAKDGALMNGEAVARYKAEQEANNPDAQKQKQNMENQRGSIDMLASITDLNRRIEEEMYDSRMSGGTSESSLAQELQSQVDNFTKKVLQDSQKEKDALAEVMKDLSAKQISMLHDLNNHMGRNNKLSQEGIDVLTTVGAITDDTAKKLRQQLVKVIDPMPSR